MNRYKKANEGIHAPEEAKEKAAQSAGKRSYRRWMGAVAAVLAVAILGGTAAWAGRNMGSFAALSNKDPSWVEPASVGSDAPAPQSDDSSDRVRSAPENSGDGAHYAHALSLAAGYELPPCPEPDDLDLDPASDDFLDAWLELNEAWREAAGLVYAELDGIEAFAAASSAQFLTGAGEENRVYSPLNLYMALAMLAETAGGDSRQQILDVLGEDSIEAVRKNAAAVWRNYYQDDDRGISVMANSLWLRDDITCSQDTLDTLSANYYTSSFAGEMGSAEYTKALRDWINEQTRGMLAEQADGLFFDPATVLGLASTLYFKSAWSDPFSPERNTWDVFHTPSGDMETEFMHREMWYGSYCWGEHFSALSLGLQASNYSMWLVLPDDGYTVDDLLESGAAMEFLMASKYGVYDEETGEETGGWPNRAYVKVNLSLPKFDVSSDLDLIEGLKELGVTGVFDPAVSNFDPLEASTDDPLYVSKAQHAARVKVDEEGCEAAAYTVMMIDCGGAAPPNDEVDFTLDRPFLFAITGDSNLPLFTGVVNQPNG